MTAVIRSLETYASSGSADPTVFYLQALAYGEMGDYEKALDACQTGLEHCTDPRLGLKLRNLAMAFQPSRV